MNDSADSIRVMCPLFQAGEGGSIPTSALQLRFGAIDPEAVHKFPETGAEIVSWGEERWQQLFWARFIRNLPPDTVLVWVDYHV